MGLTVAVSSMDGICMPGQFIYQFRNGHQDIGYLFCLCLMQSDHSSTWIIDKLNISKEILIFKGFKILPHE